MAIRVNRIGLAGAVLVAGLAFGLAADTVQPALKVGDKAPSFTAKDADGKTWSSSEHFRRNPGRSLLLSRGTDRRLHQTSVQL